MPLRTLHSHPFLLYRISGSGLVIGFCAIVVALNCALALHKLSRDRIAVQNDARVIAVGLAQHLAEESGTLINIGDLALRLAFDNEDATDHERITGSPVIDLWEESPAAGMAKDVSRFSDPANPDRDGGLLLTRQLPDQPDGQSRSAHVLLDASLLRRFTSHLPEDFAPRTALYDGDGQTVFVNEPTVHSQNQTIAAALASSDWSKAVVVTAPVDATGLQAEVRIAQTIIDYHASVSLLSMIPYALAQTAAVLFCGALALHRIHRERIATDALQLAYDTLDERVKQRTAALEATNSRLEAALQDKGVLLREVQHRVLNNLQVVNSLLRLQAGRLPDAARHGFSESQRRLATLTLLQGRLQSSPRMGMVEMSSLLEELARTAESESGRPISLNTALEEWWLDADSASPVLLIADEALSNSFAHGFPPGHSASATVWLRNGRNSDGQQWLSIQDNGIGMSPPDQFGSGVAIPAKKGLGMTLIELLARQVRGQLTIASTGDGTLISLTLPASPDQTA